MGNIFSDKNKDNKNDLLEKMESIASEYILSQSYQDMLKLHDSTHCDNLVILTSNLLNEYLNIEEIQYISDTLNSQQLKSGDNLSEDTVVWVNKDNLPNDNLKKKLCIGVAKRYVKIAHIFSAIITTINPIYKYTDEHGDKILVELKHKHLIPPYANVTVDKHNLCSSRINILSNGFNTSTSNIKINPNICNINKQTYLFDEPGIAELELLYNDIYDYNTGQYVGRSKTMEQQYENDLDAFYKIFTNNNQRPPHIKSFKDIKVKEFSDNISSCNNVNLQYEDSSTLFKEYAKNIKESIKNTQENESKLMKQLDKLFIKSPDNKYVINNELSFNSLNKIVDETRDIIINCYMSCEKYFVKGLEIVEAIVENQTKNVTKSQITELEKKILEM